MTQIAEERVIWFPGVYAGRTDAEYTTKIADISLNKLTDLVKKRAQEDGQWAIDNGLVGSNEERMLEMMAFVANPVNIQQCVGHILKAKEERIRTVDWVCRDLANASKWAAHVGT